MKRNCKRKKRMGGVGSTEAARLAQLEKCIPDIWSYKRVLYVGANVNRFHFAGALKRNKCRTDVLEIDRKRCNGLLKKHIWLNRVIHGDVTRVSDLIRGTTYDMCIWSHGPEIFPKRKIRSTLAHLQEITSGLLVLLAPWGTPVQRDTVHKFDRGVTELYVSDFIKWGFDAAVLGVVNTVGSNLLGWKYLDECSEKVEAGQET